MKMPPKALIVKALDDFINQQIPEAKTLSDVRARTCMRAGADFMYDFLSDAVRVKTKPIAKQHYKPSELKGRNYAILCNDSDEWERIKKLTDAQPDTTPFPRKKYNAIDTTSSTYNFGALSFYRRKKFIIIDSNQVY